MARTPDPLVKLNSTLSLTASTLLRRLVLLSVCFNLFIQCQGKYKLGLERLTRIENSNVLRLPVIYNGNLKSFVWTTMN